MIPGNPHADGAENYMGELHREGKSHEAHLIGAVLALTYEQHQRNRLAAITAKHRGLALPADLDDLTREKS